MDTDSRRTSSVTPSGSTTGSVRASAIPKISLRSGASPCPTRRFGSGVGGSVLRTPGSLRHRQGRLGDTWHLDELFVSIRGRQQYLWRAVDQDADVIDILLQPRRDRRAAERFFRKLLKGQGCAPRRLITDKLRSYSAAHRIVMPSVVLVPS
jgi:hypothetical protein